jgi:hypothetical protein
MGKMACAVCLSDERPSLGRRTTPRRFRRKIRQKHLDLPAPKKDNSVLLPGAKIPFELMAKGIKTMYGPRL